MKHVLAMVLCLVCSCAKKELVPEVRHLPITEQAKELTTLPNYQKPIETGQAMDVSKGDEVPFDGILLTEDKAVAAISLRISYDELYRLAESDRKYMLSVIQIQEQMLQKGDDKIEKLNGELHDLRTSWWENNKMELGIASGLILGVAITAGAGAIWANMQSSK